MRLDQLLAINHSLKLSCQDSVATEVRESSTIKPEVLKDLVEQLIVQK